MPEQQSESLRDIQREVRRRRTFAIISHPDAGKTTLTERLLVYGGAIQLAGTVKARKASRHAASDWMELEKQRMRQPSARTPPKLWLASPYLILRPRKEKMRG